MGFTVWTAWFFAVLIAAGVDCWRSRDRELQLAWAVMAIAWVASMLAWKVSSVPLVDLTVKNIVVMALLLTIAFRPETAVPALLYGLVILAAYLAAIGYIPSVAARPRQFLAFSYPDIAAGLQHVSLILLAGPWLRHVLGDHTDNRRGADLVGVKGLPISAKEGLK